MRTLEEGKVYKVWSLISRGGRTLGHFVVDVQKDEGIAYAVLEWQDMHDGEIPAYRLPIEERQLSVLDWPQAEFLYSVGIVVPADAPPYLPHMPPGPK